MEYTQRALAKSMVDVPWLRLGGGAQLGGNDSAPTKVTWKVAWSVSFHHVHDISLKNLLRIDLDLFHISTSSAACAQSVRPLSLSL